MRVLLVNPPLSQQREVAPPLGLCVLASKLRANGHNPRILDLDLEMKCAPISEAGMTALLSRTMAEFEPHVVGVTSMYNNSLQAERLIVAAKEQDPTVATIAGGSHFGALGARALKRCDALDFAIEGEGEGAFSALLTVLDAGEDMENVARLQWRKDGEIQVNPPAGLIDLATLPPVWSQLGETIDIERYRATIPSDSPRRTIYVEAGRGCPYACSFCATAPFWERKYRVKPVAALIEELRFLHEAFGYDGFVLVHDLLTVDKSYVNDLCEALVEARLPVEWMANHRTDIDLAGLLPKMKAAGCWAMFFGVETASPRLQRAVRKGLRRKEVVSTISALADLGIASTCSFVIGFPDETSEELSSTVALGAELKLKGAGLIQFHRLRLWPPSPLFKQAPEARFDAESLAIEYPFLEARAEDVAAIQADREFFAGYFAPLSRAGAFPEIAQIELFFTSAVAVAPLTVAVLGRLMGDALIATFVTHVFEAVGVTRSQIEARSTQMSELAALLLPLILRWIQGALPVGSWSPRLAEAALEYEMRKLAFLDNLSLGADVLAGPDWVAFVSSVDIAAVFTAMHDDAPLTTALETRTMILFVRETSGACRAFCGPPAEYERLQSSPRLAMGALAGSHRRDLDTLERR